MQKIFAVTVVAATMLAGCMTVGNKVDPNVIASFTPGQTTVAQAEAALGKPFQVSQMPDGSQLLQYVATQQVAASGAVPETGTSIPKHAEQKVSTLLTFDAQGHFVRSSSNAATAQPSAPRTSIGNSSGALQQGDVTNSR
ncbi:MAG: hypothetical protein WA777_21430 [Rhodanobacter sp.]